MKVLNLFALVATLGLTLQSQALTIPAQPSQVKVAFDNYVELGVSIDSKEVVRFESGLSCEGDSVCGNALLGYANAILSEAAARGENVLVDTSATDVTGLLQLQSPAPTCK